MLLIMVSKLCTKFDICPPLLSTVASDIEEGAKCVAYGVLVRSAIDHLDAAIAEYRRSTRALEMTSPDDADQMRFNLGMVKHSKSYVNGSIYALADFLDGPDLAQVRRSCGAGRGDEYFDALRNAAAEVEAAWKKNLPSDLTLSLIEMYEITASEIIGRLGSKTYHTGFPQP